MFHNDEMETPTASLHWSNKSLLFGAAFALMSICLHALLVTWVGGTLELSSWNPPLRDTPISISLHPEQRAAPPLASMPREQQRQAIAPPRKPRIVAKSVVTDADELLSKNKTESVDNAAIAQRETTADPKPEVAQKEDTKPDVQVEPTLENKNDKAILGEQPIYLGGLGGIPIAGAFAYTFYMGDYTLNNPLGSGSFIVESGDSKYKLVLIGKAAGLTSLIFSGATYRSEGAFGSDGFAPQLFAEKSGNRAERVAQVDYIAKEVTLGDQKKSTLLGMQDRVSVIWQVGLVLRAKPEFAETGRTLPIPLMSTRALDNAQFISQGVADIDKRGVLVKAVHFKFKPANPQNKAQIDLWYDLNNLPQPLRVRWIDERERTLDIFRDD
jgi:Protein of unknown function (DUF3108)